MRLADEKIKRKTPNQISRFDKHFSAAAEEFGLEVLDFTSEEFEEGLPLTPINLSHFAPEENLFVEAMLEPTIKISGTASIVRKDAAIYVDNRGKRFYGKKAYENSFCQPENCAKLFK